MNDNRMLQLIVDKLNALSRGIKGVEGRISKKIDKTNQRIDKIGASLACLEDDAPTRDEFDSLERRVDKIENRIIAS